MPRFKDGDKIRFGNKDASVTARRFTLDHSGQMRDAANSGGVFTVRHCENDSLSLVEVPIWTWAPEDFFKADEKCCRECGQVIPLPPIFIDGKEVHFLNGRIKVGCTDVPNSTVLEIAKRLPAAD